MRYLCFCTIILVGCQTDSPISPQEDAAKAITQEFPCEAAILDTMIQAVLIRESSATGNEYFPLLSYISEWGGFFNYEGDGEHYAPPVAVYTTTSTQQTINYLFGETILELFRQPSCNVQLEALLQQEIVSSKYKIERYACAIKEIETLMDNLWIGEDCGKQCWDDLNARLERAYQRYELYKDQLQYTEHVQSVYFGENAACN